MAISHDFANKFAFLFTGSADPQYIEDLRNTAGTLINFYGYQPANVWLVSGAVVNEFDAVGHPDPSSIFQTPGIHTPYILSGTTSADITDDLGLQIDTFMLALDHEIVSGYQNSVFFYFTGVGERVTSPLTVYYLDIAMIGATPVRVNPAWFKGMLTTYASSYPYNHLNILMQQSYSYGFFEGTNGLNTISDASLRMTFTSACNSSETIDPDATGSSFTRYWTQALQFATRFTGIANIFADQEDTNTLVLPATNAEDKTNFLISVKKAWCFAKAQSGKTPVFDYKGDSLDYLGLPSFFIQDGQPYWWESPDIYLTHPNAGNPLKENDLYVTDSLSATAPFNNTINVKVRNIGTHPVRSYRIGIRVFRTPSGGSTDILEENGRVPAGIVLKPSRKTNYNLFSPDSFDRYTWNTPFYTGITHECVWAKVFMTTPDVVANPFDFSYNVQANDFEAQRNTDPGSDPPKSRKSRIPGDNFRGLKRHVYQIQNPFRETYDFMLVTTPEFQRSLGQVTMNWLNCETGKKMGRLYPEAVEKGFTGLHFTLKGGESKDIIGEFGLKQDVKKGTAFRLPVEVVVNRIEGSGTKKPMAKALHGKYAAIAGFTIIISSEPATLICSVVDKKKNPLPGARVLVQTINGQAKEEFIADRKGVVLLKNINPDVYRISAYYKTLLPDERIIELNGGKPLTVELQLSSKKGK